MVGRKNNLNRMWDVLMGQVDLGEPTCLLDRENLGCTQREGKPNLKILHEKQRLARIFDLRRYCQTINCLAMEGLAKKMCGKILRIGKQESGATLHALCMDDHQFKDEELDAVGELSKVCSKIVMKCLYSARIGGPEIFWSVNDLARAFTNWNKASGKRLARLISYIHFTTGHGQHCHVRHSDADWVSADFAGDMKDSKSTPQDFGSHTFAPCEKKKAVSQ